MTKKHGIEKPLALADKLVTFLEGMLYFLRTHPAMSPRPFLSGVKIY